MGEWNPQLYDSRFSFVSGYGKDVVELLNPQKGERILDLGCGTGELAKEIATRGAEVTGIDLSPAMIERAREKYPDIRFEVGNGESFRVMEPFDAVFSNAALHWMKRPANVIESVWLALRPGGRFVAEFGGKGNVQTIIDGIADVLAEQYGIKASQRNPWYFPSIAQYSRLLERQGFRVVYAVHFDRPTALAGGEEGLNHWLDSFADAFFRRFSPAERQALYGRIAQRVKPALYKNGAWIADYKRIRIMAVKEA